MSYPARIDWAARIGAGLLGVSWASFTAAVITRYAFVVVLLAVQGVYGCGTRPPAQEALSPTAQGTPSPAPASLPPAPIESTTSAPVEPSAPPPLAQDGSPDETFSLEQATVGLVGQGRLLAKLETDMGNLTCELFDDRAPLAVANFVGLARGLRPFKEGDDWVKRPAYDGTIFHRIIRGFMIQGGDPTNTGSGEPGYSFLDEIWPGSKHDRRGQLCTANRGKDTNGTQFFITDGPAPHLDGKFPIFGECEPETVIEKLGAVEVRGWRSRPVTPVRLKRVHITRERDASRGTRG